MIVPFPAGKDRPTLEKIFTILESGDAPLPYNAKLKHHFEIAGNCESSICLFTSGTTAMPKIAVTPLEGHRAAAKACPIPLTSKDGWLIDLPLYHVAALAIAFRCTRAGANVIFPGEDPLAVTHISCVPTQLRRYLQNGFPYPNLHTILVGGSFVELSLINAVQKRGYTVHTSYGMTETCAMLACDGKVLPHMEVKIADGEIFVRGKSLFAGYLGKPSPFIEGWFPTGDLGTFEKGRLQVTGRKDRMFISGGENIYPEEIEEALRSIDGILSAHVEAQKCIEFGARPVAYIRTKKTICDKQLREMLREKLISWKVPSTILQEGE